MFKLLIRTLAVALVLAPLGAAGLPIVNVTKPDLTDLGPNPLATFSAGTVFQNVTGSQWNRRSPYDKGPAALLNSASYTSVSGGASATYDFGSSRTLLSLLWGSPDSYNTLKFFFEGAPVGSVGGSDIVSNPGFEFSSGSGYGFVTVTGLTFDSVTFKSGSNAFEFAGLSAVPLPGAVWLFGSFLLGLAGYNSRKRRVRGG